MPAAASHIKFPTTQLSPEQLQSKLQGKQIAIIYPYSPLRTFFLSYFLENIKDGLLYYRVGIDIANLNEWLSGLLTEIGSIVKKFGEPTKAALQAHQSAAQLGATFASDLATINPEHVMLYLDDLDRVTFEDEFNQFIQAFVGALPTHVKLVVSSRVLSRSPWYDFVASGTATILGAESRRSGVMFNLEENPRPQLECYAFGRGQVLLNGKPITTWEGTLPRTLTFFLIDRPLATRDEIFEAFWPELNIKDATNVFHVTKRKVNERVTSRIEDGTDYELTQYTSGFYIASDRIARHYDVFEFTDAVEQALVANDERKELQLFQRAVDLYRAPFLQTVTMPWAEKRRDTLRRLYALALTGMGRIFLRRNEHNRALGYLSRAVREAPEREDVHRDVITLYLHFGMVQEAFQQYDALESALKAAGNLAPSKDSRDLRDQIKARL